MTTSFDTCSPNVKNALLWLEQHLGDKNDWTYRDALMVYSIFVIDPNHEIVNQFKKASENPEFWDEDMFFDDADLIYYLHQIGLSEQEGFNENVGIVEIEQNMSGYLPGGHASTLRGLVATDSYPETLNLGLSYFLDFWESSDDLCEGMLALQELDFDKHFSVIEEMAKHIADSQDDSGAFNLMQSSFHRFSNTCYGVIALSRMSGFSEQCEKAGNYIRTTQVSNGSWENAKNTALAILALNAIGEGVKVPTASIQWNNLLSQQRYQKSLPVFLHTSPLFEKTIHVKQIHDKTLEMLNKATRIIRVSSLYVDMLYENIIDVIQENNIEVRIIVRPRKDIQGIREKISKSVLDILSISTRGKVRTNPIIHARMIIVDDKEVLISTSDLTRDQLFDEYNAGIWTRNQTIVENAIKFFDNVWEESDVLS
jgi:hypothetical protein